MIGPLVHMIAHGRNGDVEDWGNLHIAEPLTVGEFFNLQRHDSKGEPIPTIPPPVGGEGITIRDVKHLVPTRRKGLLSLLREFDGPSIELHFDVHDWSSAALDFEIDE